MTIYSKPTQIETNNSLLMPSGALLHGKNAQFLPPDSLVLDYGSGSGWNTSYYTELGHSVVAVDIDVESLFESRRKSAELGNLAVANTLHIMGDLENPMFKDQSFDAVVCTNALQFINRAKKENVLSNFRALTKPGGFNFIKAYMGTPEDQLEKPKHALYQPGELKQSYENAGWKIIEHLDVLRPMDRSEPGVIRVSSSSSIVAKKPDSIMPGHTQSEYMEYLKRSDPEFYELQLELGNN